MANSIVSHMLSLLSKEAKEPLRRMRDALRAVPYYGVGRWCPVCSKPSRRFRTAGLVPREDAECAHCGAGERHRLVWLYLTRRGTLSGSQVKRMLHVAPERCLEAPLRAAVGPGYITADLENRRAQVRMDITAIPHPDGLFDAIYCSHVLEHVQDDRGAMREFHRVLHPRGWALLLVPITVERTFEDPRIVTPWERLTAFGQKDHVRRYGPDFVDRLREAGFRVAVTRVADLYGSAEATRMGLTAACGEIYYCTKEQR